MLTLRNRICSALLGMALALACMAPAMADDTEIYVNAATPSPGIRPNILFIVDTSGSMDTPDASGERTAYDPDTTYGRNGTCRKTRIFFRRSGEPMPDCNGTNYIVSDTTYNKCAAMLAAIVGISGRWSGKTAQFDETAQIWRDLQANGTSESVECLADSGINGGDSSNKVYARNGDKNNKWTSNSAASIDWTQRTTYTFYLGNWLNWHIDEKADKTLSRLDSVKAAVTGLASSIDGVNLGLMRYSNNFSGGKHPTQTASGGYITQPVLDVTSNRDDIITAVNAFTPDGFTPLSETLYEAGLYFKGGTVRFGDSSQPALSINTSRKTTNSHQYQSPIIGQCQKSFIVYLTDGLPTQDNEANDDIASLNHLGACTLDSTLNPAQTATDDGICLDDMAKYLHTNDLNTTLTGAQTVTTYTIGFGSEVKDNPFLDRVADAGGGKRFDASNSDSLTEVLTNITSDVLDTATTFSTASVGVNAFNRSTTRDDLYFAVFAPHETLRWDGNLKKYKLAVDSTDAANPKLIITGQGTPTDAIDETTGFFKDTTRSFWSPSNDGNDITAGGAVSQLPADTARTIYTYLTATSPAGSPASLVSLRTAPAAAFGPGTAAADVTTLLDFAYGADVQRMGDPLHSQPAIVTYSGTATAPNDIVYVATNDGYLHAINAQTGVEQWAFIPKELLPRLKDLYANAAVTNRSYGLDGDVRILKLDFNQDGIIDSSAGDRVWLYIGMRRGGHSYYALDVTIPATPKMMWFDSASDLPGLGETWSPPSITRVSIQGATQNNQKLVLIFGGGYDGAQENTTQVDDSTGNQIFMVDAKSGALLWYGTLTPPAVGSDNIGTTAQRALRTKFDDMKNSIPGRITVIDTNGDLFADRMYAGDMGGRVWRFDINNDQPVNTLVTGGVFAELGQGGVASPSKPDTRRFYNAPDVALVQRRGEDPYYNLAIGSGYRGHPLSLDMVDRFYSLRDKQPFAKLGMGDYGPTTRLKETSLVDITTNHGSTVKASDMGWEYIFNTNSGEKVLAEATTVNDVILVSTFQPGTPTVQDPCRPLTVNRVYAFSVDNGAPVLDLNRDGTIDAKDISQQVIHDGILGNVNVGLLRGDLADQLKSKTPGPPTVCLAGMHILGSCVQVDDSVRTYWRKNYDQSN